MIDAILTMLAWLLGIIVFVVGGYVIHTELQFKHKAIVKENNKGTNLLRILRAKEYKDTDGSLWWKIKGYSEAVPRPPNKALTLNDKGKYIAKFYQLDGGELTPIIEDNLEFNEDSNEFIQRTQPTTAPQRQIIVSQIMKAKREQGKSMAEMMMFALPFAVLIIIITLVMIFADEALQPAIQIGESNQMIADKLIIAMEKLDTVINNRIHINSIEGAVGGTPTIP